MSNRVSFTEPRLRFFGGARLDVVGDGPGRAAHRRRLALLAILATSPHQSATRDRLIGLLWPETTQEKARRALSEAIYVIRRELGDDALSTEGAVITLRLDADVSAFRTLIAEDRLEEAVALHRGPFLDSWYVDDAEAFERWAEDERRRLEGEYRTALASLANRGEQSGDFEATTRWLRRLVDADPLSTRATVRLARLLGSAGEHGDALQLIVRHKARLAEELGVAPADELLQVEHDLRRARDPVTREPAVPPIEPTSSGPDITVAGSPTTAPAPVGRRGRRIVMGGVAALTVLGLVAMALRSPSTGLQYDRHHVAVLYFDDHSNGRQLGYIAEGLTEALIHELAGVPSLRVASRNAVKPFRGTPLRLDSTARLLRVGTIVEGSVQESGDRIRVTAQIIDAGTGLHDTSLTFDARTDDLFRAEEDLATGVAAALRRTLGRGVELSARNAGSEPVRRLVQQAHALQRRANQLRFDARENDARAYAALLRRADSLLEQAHRLNPRLNTVYELRARGYYAQAVHADSVGRVAAFQAGLAVLSAMPPGALRDSSDMLYLRGAMRWGLLMAGLHRAGDSTTLGDAEGDLRGAIAIDSANAPAWATLSQLLLLKGAYAEAENAARHALIADAYLDGAEETMFQLFVTSAYLGRLDDAEQWCRRGQVLYPRYWRFYECELTTMRDRPGARADTARAWQLVAIMDSLDPPESARQTAHPYSPINRRVMAAAVSARAGDVARAKRVLSDARRSVADSPTLQDDLLFDQAYLEELFGDRRAAVATLRRLLARRPFIRETLLRDPFFRTLSDSLRLPLAE